MAVTGLITVNGKEILELDSDPSQGAGVASPLGSMAIYDDGIAGHVFIKKGSADTAWAEIDTPENADWTLSGNALTGATPNAPDQVFGSTNDFDVVFKRNSVEQMRLVSGALLVGLNASLGGRLQVGGAALGDELLKQSTAAGGVGGARVIRVTRQYKVQTTNGSPAVLASLLVPASSRVQAKFFVGCNQHGGTAGAVGDGADYERTVSAKRLATGNAVLGKVQTDFTFEDVSTFNASFAVNANNIDLSVLGGLNRNLAWSAHAEIQIFAD